MNLQPLVSIIIPTYNREVLLKDAILSVLGQTYKNFELIIVDDCSKYDIKKIADSFKDNRIKYFRHEKNSGVSASCNTGIKKASGNYVFILNDDDLIVPSALEKFVDKFQESKIENLGGIYSWSWWINNNGKTFTITNSKRNGDISKRLFKEQLFTNAFVKREVFDSVGLYNETLKVSEDFDFYMRMSKKYQFDCVHEILYIKRQHNLGQLSNFTKSFFNDQQNVFNGHLGGKSWSAKNIIAIILPDNIYIKASEIKNYLILKLNFILHPGLIKETRLIRRALKKSYIDI